MAATSNQMNKKKKKLSREKLREELGPAIEINMSGVTKTRLKAICKIFGHDTIDSMKRGTGRVYSKVLDELINIYFFDELLEPKKPEAKRLYDLYNEFYELKFREEKMAEEIVAHMTKHKRGRPGNPSDTVWQEGDIERLISSRKVVNKITRIDGATNSVTAAKP